MLSHFDKSGTYDHQLNEYDEYTTFNYQYETDQWKRFQTVVEDDIIHTFYRTKENVDAHKEWRAEYMQYYDNFEESREQIENVTPDEIVDDWRGWTDRYVQHINPNRPDKELSDHFDKLMYDRYLPERFYWSTKPGHSQPYASYHAMSPFSQHWSGFNDSLDNKRSPHQFETDEGPWDLPLRYADYMLDTNESMNLWIPTFDADHVPQARWLSQGYGVPYDPQKHLLQLSWTGYDPMGRQVETSEERQTAKGEYGRPILWDLYAYNGIPQSCFNYAFSAYKPKIQEGTDMLIRCVPGLAQENRRYGSLPWNVASYWRIHIDKIHYRDEINDDSALHFYKNDGDKLELLFNEWIHEKYGYIDATTIERTLREESRLAAIKNERYFDLEDPYFVRKEAEMEAKIQRIHDFYPNIIEDNMKLSDNDTWLLKHELTVQVIDPVTKKASMKYDDSAILQAYQRMEQRKAIHEVHKLLTEYKESRKRVQNNPLTLTRRFIRLANPIYLILNLLFIEVPKRSFRLVKKTLTKISTILTSRKPIEKLAASFKWPNFLKLPNFNFGKLPIIDFISGLTKLRSLNSMRKYTIHYVTSSLKRMMNPIRKRFTKLQIKFDYLSRFVVPRILKRLALNYAPFLLKTSKYGRFTLEKAMRKDPNKKAVYEMPLELPLNEYRFTFDEFPFRALFDFFFPWWRADKFMNDQYTYIDGYVTKAAVLGQDEYTVNGDPLDEADGTDDRSIFSYNDPQLNTKSKKKAGYILDSRRATVDVPTTFEPGSRGWYLFRIIDLTTLGLASLFYQKFFFDATFDEFPEKLMQAAVFTYYNRDVIRQQPTKAYRYYKAHFQDLLYPLVLVGKLYYGKWTKFWEKTMDNFKARLNMQKELLTTMLTILPQTQYEYLQNTPRYFHMKRFLTLSLKKFYYSYILPAISEYTHKIQNSLSKIGLVSPPADQSLFWREEKNPHRRRLLQLQAEQRAKWYQYMADVAFLEYDYGNFVHYGDLTKKQRDFVLMSILPYIYYEYQQLYAKYTNPMLLNELYKNSDQNEINNYQNEFFLNQNETYNQNEAQKMKNLVRKEGDEFINNLITQQDNILSMRALNSNDINAEFDQLMGQIGDDAISNTRMIKNVNSQTFSNDPQMLSFLSTMNNGEGLPDTADQSQNILPFRAFSTQESSLDGMLQSYQQYYSQHQHQHQLSATQNSQKPPHSSRSSHSSHSSPYQTTQSIDQSNLFDHAVYDTGLANPYSSANINILPVISPAFKTDNDPWSLQPKQIDMNTATRRHERSETFAMKLHAREPVLFNRYEPRNKNLIEGFKQNILLIHQGLYETNQFYHEIVNSNPLLFGTLMEAPVKRAQEITGVGGFLEQNFGEEFFGQSAVKSGHFEHDSLFGQKKSVRDNNSVSNLSHPSHYTTTTTSNSSGTLSDYGFSFSQYTGSNGQNPTTNPHNAPNSPQHHLQNTSLPTLQRSFSTPLTTTTTSYSSSTSTPPNSPQAQPLQSKYNYLEPIELISTNSEDPSDQTYRITESALPTSDYEGFVPVKHRFTGAVPDETASDFFGDPDADVRLEALSAEERQQEDKKYKHRVYVAQRHALHNLGSEPDEGYWSGRREVDFYKTSPLLKKYKKEKFNLENGIESVKKRDSLEEIKKKTVMAMNSPVNGTEWFDDDIAANPNTSILMSKATLSKWTKYYHRDGYYEHQYDPNKPDYVGDDFDPNNSRIGNDLESQAFRQRHKLFTYYELPPAYKAVVDHQAKTNPSFFESTKNGKFGRLYTMEDYHTGQALRTKNEEIDNLQPYGFELYEAEQALKRTKPDLPPGPIPYDILVGYVRQLYRDSEIRNGFDLNMSPIHHSKSEIYRQKGFNQGEFNGAFWTNLTSSFLYSNGTLALPTPRNQGTTDPTVQYDGSIDRFSSLFPTPSLEFPNMDNITSTSDKVDAMNALYRSHLDNNDLHYTSPDSLLEQSKRLHDQQDDILYSESRQYSTNLLSSEDLIDYYSSVQPHGPFLVNPSHFTNMDLFYQFGPQFPSLFSYPEIIPRKQNRYNAESLAKRRQLETKLYGDRVGIVKGPIVGSAEPRTPPSMLLKSEAKNVAKKTDTNSNGAKNSSDPNFRLLDQTNIQAMLHDDSIMSNVLNKSVHGMTLEQQKQYEQELKSINFSPTNFLSKYHDEFMNNGSIPFGTSINYAWETQGSDILSLSLPELKNKFIGNISHEMLDKHKILIPPVLLHQLLTKPAYMAYKHYRYLALLRRYNDFIFENSDKRIAVLLKYGLGSNVADDFDDSDTYDPSTGYLASNLNKSPEALLEIDIQKRLDNLNKLEQKLNTEWRELYNSGIGKAFGQPTPASVENDFNRGQELVENLQFKWMDDKSGYWPPVHLWTEPFFEKKYQFETRSIPYHFLNYKPFVKYFGKSVLLTNSNRYDHLFVDSKRPVFPTVKELIKNDTNRDPLVIDPSFSPFFDDSLSDIKGIKSTFMTMVSNSEDFVTPLSKIDTFEDFLVFKYPTGDILQREGSRVRQLLLQNEMKRLGMMYPEYMNYFDEKLHQHLKKDEEEVAWLNNKIASISDGTDLNKNKHKINRGLDTYEKSQNVTYFGEQKIKPTREEYEYSYSKFSSLNREEQFELERDFVHLKLIESAQMRLILEKQLHERKNVKKAQFKFPKSPRLPLFYDHDILAQNRPQIDLKEQLKSRNLDGAGPMFSSGLSVKQQSNLYNISIDTPGGMLPKNAQKDQAFSEFLSGDDTEGQILFPLKKVGNMQHGVDNTTGTTVFKPLPDHPWALGGDQNNQNSQQNSNNSEKMSPNQFNVLAMDEYIVDPDNGDLYQYNHDFELEMKKEQFRSHPLFSPSIQTVTDLFPERLNVPLIDVGITDDDGSPVLLNVIDFLNDVYLQAPQKSASRIKLEKDLSHYRTQQLQNRRFITNGEVLPDTYMDFLSRDEVFELVWRNKEKLPEDVQALMTARRNNNDINDLTSIVDPRDLFNGKANSKNEKILKERNKAIKSGGMSPQDAIAVEIHALPQYHNASTRLNKARKSQDLKMSQNGGNRSQNRPSSSKVATFSPNGNSPTNLTDMDDFFPSDGSTRPFHRNATGLMKYLEIGDSQSHQMIYDEDISEREHFLNFAQRYEEIASAPQRQPGQSSYQSMLNSMFRLPLFSNLSADSFKYQDKVISDEAILKSLDQYMVFDLNPSLSEENLPKNYNKFDFEIHHPAQVQERLRTKRRSEQFKEERAQKVFEEALGLQYKLLTQEGELHDKTLLREMLEHDDDLKNEANKLQEAKIYDFISEQRDPLLKLEKIRSQIEKKVELFLLEQYDSDEIDRIIDQEINQQEQKMLYTLSNTDIDSLTLPKDIKTELKRVNISNKEIETFTRYEKRRDEMESHGIVTPNDRDLLREAKLNLQRFSKQMVKIKNPYFLSKKELNNLSKTTSLDDIFAMYPVDPLQPHVSVQLFDAEQFKDLSELENKRRMNPNSIKRAWMPEDSDVLFIRAREEIGETDKHPWEPPVPEDFDTVEGLVPFIHRHHMREAYTPYDPQLEKMITNQQSVAYDVLNEFNSSLSTLPGLRSKSQLRRDWLLKEIRHDTLTRLENGEYISPEDRAKIVQYETALIKEDLRERKNLQKIHVSKRLRAFENDNRLKIGYNDYGEPIDEYGQKINIEKEFGYTLGGLQIDLTKLDFDDEGDVINVYGVKIPKDMLPEFPDLTYKTNISEELRPERVKEVREEYYKDVLKSWGYEGVDDPHELKDLKLFRKLIAQVKPKLMEHDWGPEDYKIVDITTICHDEDNRICDRDGYYLNSEGKYLYHVDTHEKVHYLDVWLKKVQDMKRNDLNEFRLHIEQDLRFRSMKEKRLRKKQLKRLEDERVKLMESGQFDVAEDTKNNPFYMTPEFIDMYVDLKYNLYTHDSPSAETLMRRQFYFPFVMKEMKQELDDEFELIYELERLNFFTIKGYESQYYEKDDELDNKRIEMLKRRSKLYNQDELEYFQKLNSNSHLWASQSVDQNGNLIPLFGGGGGGGDDGTDGENDDGNSDDTDDGLQIFKIPLPRQDTASSSDSDELGDNNERYAKIHHRFSTKNKKVNKIRSTSTQITLGDDIHRKFDWELDEDGQIVEPISEEEKELLALHAEEERIARAKSSPLYHDLHEIDPNLADSLGGSVNKGQSSDEEAKNGSSGDVTTDGDDDDDDDDWDPDDLQMFRGVPKPDFDHNLLVFSNEDYLVEKTHQHYRAVAKTSPHLLKNLKNPGSPNLLNSDTKKTEQIEGKRSKKSIPHYATSRFRKLKHKEIDEYYSNFKFRSTRDSDQQENGPMIELHKGNKDSLFSYGKKKKKTGQFLEGGLFEVYYENQFSERELEALLGTIYYDSNGNLARLDDESDALIKEISFPFQGYHAAKQRQKERVREMKRKLKEEKLKKLKEENEQKQREYEEFMSDPMANRYKVGRVLPEHMSDTVKSEFATKQGLRQIEKNQTVRSERDRRRLEYNGTQGGFFGKLKRVFGSDGSEDSTDIDDDDGNDQKNNKNNKNNQNNENPNKLDPDALEFEYQSDLDEGFNPFDPEHIQKRIDRNLEANIIEQNGFKITSQNDPSEIERQKRLEKIKQTEIENRVEKIRNEKNEPGNPNRIDIKRADMSAVDRFDREFNKQQRLHRRKLIKEQRQVQRQKRALNKRLHYIEGQLYKELFGRNMYSSDILADGYGVAEEMIPHGVREKRLFELKHKIQERSKEIQIARNEQNDPIMGHLESLGDDSIMKSSKDIFSNDTELLPYLESILDLVTQDKLQKIEDEARKNGEIPTMAEMRERKLARKQLLPGDNLDHKAEDDESSHEFMREYLALKKEAGGYDGDLHTIYEKTMQNMVNLSPAQREAYLSGNPNIDIQNAGKQPSEMQFGPRSEELQNATASIGRHYEHLYPAGFDDELHDELNRMFDPDEFEMSDEEDDWDLEFGPDAISQLNRRRDHDEYPSLTTSLPTTLQNNLRKNLFGKSVFKEKRKEQKKQLKLHRLEAQLAIKQSRNGFRQDNDDLDEVFDDDDDYDDFFELDEYDAAVPSNDELFHFALNFLKTGINLLDDPSIRTIIYNYRRPGEADPAIQPHLWEKQFEKGFFEENYTEFKKQALNNWQDTTFSSSLVDHTDYALIKSRQDKKDRELAIGQLNLLPDGSIDPDDDNNKRILKEQFEIEKKLDKMQNRHFSDDVFDKNRSKLLDKPGADGGSGKLFRKFNKMSEESFKEITEKRLKNEQKKKKLYTEIFMNQNDRYWELKSVLETFIDIPSLSKIDLNDYKFDLTQLYFDSLNSNAKQNDQKTMENLSNLETLQKMEILENTFADYQKAKQNTHTSRGQVVDPKTFPLNLRPNFTLSAPQRKALRRRQLYPYPSDPLFVDDDLIQNYDHNGLEQHGQSNNSQHNPQNNSTIGQEFTLPLLLGTMLVNGMIDIDNFGYYVNRITGDYAYFVPTDHIWRQAQFQLQQKQFLQKNHRKIEILKKKIINLKEKINNFELKYQRQQVDISLRPSTYDELLRFGPADQDPLAQIQLPSPASSKTTPTATTINYSHRDTTGYSQPLTREERRAVVSKDPRFSGKGKDQMGDIENAENGSEDQGRNGGLGNNKISGQITIEEIQREKESLRELSTYLNALIILPNDGKKILEQKKFIQTEILKDSFWNEMELKFINSGLEQTPIFEKKRPLCFNDYSPKDLATQVQIFIRDIQKHKKLQNQRHRLLKEKRQLKIDEAKNNVFFSKFFHLLPDRNDPHSIVTVDGLGDKIYDNGGNSDVYTDTTDVLSTDFTETSHSSRGSGKSGTVYKNNFEFFDQSKSEIFFVDEEAKRLKRNDFLQANSLFGYLLPKNPTFEPLSLPKTPEQTQEELDLLRENAVLVSLIYKTKGILDEKKRIKKIGQRGQNEQNKYNIDYTPIRDEDGKYIYRSSLAKQASREYIFDFVMMDEDEKIIFEKNVQNQLEFDKKQQKLTDSKSQNYFNNTHTDLLAHSYEYIITLKSRLLHDVDVRSRQAAIESILVSTFEKLNFYKKNSSLFAQTHVKNLSKLDPNLTNLNDYSKQLLSNLTKATKFEEFDVYSRGDVVGGENNNQKNGKKIDNKNDNKNEPKCDPSSTPTDLNQIKDLLSTNSLKKSHLLFHDMIVNHLSHQANLDSPFSTLDENIEPFFFDFDVSNDDFLLQSLIKKQSKIEQKIQILQNNIKEHVDSHDYDIIRTRLLNHMENGRKDGDNNLIEAKIVSPVDFSPIFISPTIESLHMYNSITKDEPSTLRSLLSLYTRGKKASQNFQNFKNGLQNDDKKTKLLAEFQNIEKTSIVMISTANGDKFIIDDDFLLYGFSSQRELLRQAYVATKMLERRQKDVINSFRIDADFLQHGFDTEIKANKLNNRFGINGDDNMDKNDGENFLQFTQRAHKLRFLKQRLEKLESDYFDFSIDSVTSSDQLTLIEEEIQELRLEIDTIETGKDLPLVLYTSPIGYDEDGVKHGVFGHRKRLNLELKKMFVKDQILGSESEKSKMKSPLEIDSDLDKDLFLLHPDAIIHRTSKLREMIYNVYLNSTKFASQNKNQSWFFSVTDFFGISWIFRPDKSSIASLDLGMTPLQRINTLLINKYDDENNIREMLPPSQRDTGRQTINNDNNNDLHIGEEIFDPNLTSDSAETLLDTSKTNKPSKKMHKIPLTTITDPSGASDPRFRSATVDDPIDGVADSDHPVVQLVKDMIHITSHYTSGNYRPTPYAIIPLPTDLPVLSPEEATVEFYSDLGTIFVTSADEYLSSLRKNQIYYEKMHNIIILEHEKKEAEKLGISLYEYHKRYGRGFINDKKNQIDQIDQKSNSGSSTRLSNTINGGVQYGQHYARNMEELTELERRKLNDTGFFERVFGAKQVEKMQELIPIKKLNQNVDNFDQHFGEEESEISKFDLTQLRASSYLISNEMDAILSREFFNPEIMSFTLDFNEFRPFNQKPINLQIEKTPIPEKIDEKSPHIPIPERIKEEIKEEIKENDQHYKPDHTVDELHQLSLKRDDRDELDIMFDELSTHLGLDGFIQKISGVESAGNNSYNYFGEKDNNIQIEKPNGFFSPINLTTQSPPTKNNSITLDQVPPSLSTSQVSKSAQNIRKGKKLEGNDFLFSADGVDFSPPSLTMDFSSQIEKIYKFPEPKAPQLSVPKHGFIGKTNQQYDYDGIMTDTDTKNDTLISSRADFSSNLTPIDEKYPSDDFGCFNNVPFGNAVMLTHDYYDIEQYEKFQSAKNRHFMAKEDKKAYDDAYKDEMENSELISELKRRIAELEKAEEEIELQEFIELAREYDPDASEEILKGISNREKYLRKLAMEKHYSAIQKEMEEKVDALHKPKSFWHRLRYKKDDPRRYPEPDEDVLEFMESQEDFEQYQEEIYQFNKLGLDIDLDALEFQRYNEYTNEDERDPYDPAVIRAKQEFKRGLMREITAEYEKNKRANSIWGWFETIFDFQNGLDPNYQSGLEQFGVKTPSSPIDNNKLAPLNHATEEFNDLDSYLSREEDREKYRGMAFYSQSGIKGQSHRNIKNRLGELQTAGRKDIDKELTKEEQFEKFHMKQIKIEKAQEKEKAKLQAMFDKAKNHSNDRIETIMGLNEKEKIKQQQREARLQRYSILGEEADAQAERIKGAKHAKYSDNDGDGDEAQNANLTTTSKQFGAFPSMFSGGNREEFGRAEGGNFELSQKMFTRGRGDVKEFFSDNGLNSRLANGFQGSDDDETDVDDY